MIVFLSFIKGPWLSNQGLSGLIIFLGSTLLFFGKNYVNFEEERFLKHVDRFIKGGIALGLFAFFLPPFLGELLSYFYGLTSIILSIWMTFGELKKGSLTAKYFIISLNIFIFLAIIQLLYIFQLIEPHLLIKNAVLLGTAKHSFFLVFRIFKIQRRHLIKGRRTNDANHKLKLLYRKIEKTSQA